MEITGLWPVMLGVKRRKRISMALSKSSVNKEIENIMFNKFNAGSNMKINMRPFQKQAGGWTVFYVSNFALAAVIALI